jgi:hypothetical protein
MAKTCGVFGGLVRRGMFMAKSWTFREGVHTPVGQWKRPGKPEWPGCLSVWVSRKRALELVATIARTLTRFDEDEEVQLVFMGELKEGEE